MKKLYYILILLFFCFGKFSTAQILCIYCYDQNDTISANVNNLILNGGFENGCLNLEYFCPNSGGYACDITNWTCTGGGSATYAQVWGNNGYSIIPEGAKVAYFGNFYCNACSTTMNDTSCISNTNCTVTGIPAGYPINPNPGYGGYTGVSLEQIVTGLTAGNTYVLEFWAGGENTPVMVYKGIFAVDVGFGDTLLREKPTPVVTGIGTRYIIEFNATSSSHTIKFTNWGHICHNNCTELVLDDVRLYTLAELDASVPHCTVGIDVLASLSKTSVFPNPVTNELNVKASSYGLCEIILYDITSRKLLQQKFVNSVSLNTEQLARGLYLYEVRNKNGLCKKGKVVKD